MILGASEDDNTLSSEGIGMREILIQEFGGSSITVYPTRPWTPIPIMFMDLLWRLAGVHARGTVHQLA